MEARRRQTSASTQQSHDERSHPPRKRSESATPRADDDEEPGSRRTRGRNPLPPTSGPLFPPLPPKQPKNSPKATSRSPANRTSRLTSVSALSTAMDDDASNADAGDTARIAGPADMNSPKRRPSAPSVSSLSPPPADAEEVSNPPVPVAKEGAGEGDDWDAYRRQRGVRGFSGPKATPTTIKVESTENGDGENGANDHDNEPTADKEQENGTALVEEPQSASTDTSMSAAAETAARAGRKRRGEEQLLLDDHLLPKEMRVHPPRREKNSKRSEPLEEAEPAKKEPSAEPEEPEKEKEEPEAEAEADEYDEDDSSEEITRCACKRDDGDSMMICCDKCKVWQHGECMGIWGDEEAPDEYFCELCRPDLHAPLRKWIRSRGRTANFVPPTPSDLQKLRSPSDKHPPSQSKRWTDPELMEPPPPPVKPPSRSHHKKEKEKEPAEDDANDRRSARARAKETTGGRERPAPPASSSSASKEPTRDSKRRNRRVSTDLSRSTSPPGGRFEPKKRSTMNSRDAAYEEAVKAALEASRREMSGGAEGQDPAEEPRASKRRRVEEDEGEEVKKPTSKRKKEEDDGTESSATAPAKAKHPNQYTYRPKPGNSTTSGRRGGAGTPQPATLPAHEHGTRRAGAIANNLAAAPYTPVSIYNLNWYLPDHLSAFHDLLPTPNPEPLVVPTPRSLQFLPRSHFLTQTYGPFTDEKTADGRLIMPEDQPLRATDSEAVNHREPPTRVRYPIKRITTGEMRKRVRNMLEYVGRVQLDEARRQERSKLVNIPTEMAPRPRLPPLEDELNGVSRNSRSAEPDADVEMKEPSPEPSRPPLPTSSQLLDELTRDLIAFQEAFQTGDFDSLSFVAPPPPEPSPLLSEEDLDMESGPEPEIEPEPEVQVQVTAEAEVEVVAEAEVEPEPEAEPVAEVTEMVSEQVTIELDTEPVSAVEPEAPSAIEAEQLLGVKGESEPMNVDAGSTSEEPEPVSVPSAPSEPEVKPDVTPEVSEPEPDLVPKELPQIVEPPTHPPSPRKSSEVRDPPVAVTA